MQQFVLFPIYEEINLEKNAVDANIWEKFFLSLYIFWQVKGCGGR